MTPSTVDEQFRFATTVHAIRRGADVTVFRRLHFSLSVFLLLGSSCLCFHLSTALSFPSPGRRKSSYPRAPLFLAKSSESTTITTKKNQQFIQEFSQHVATALDDQSFRRLKLRGSKKAKERGSLRQVLGRLIQLKNNNVKVQLTFKYHGATDIAKNFDVAQVPTFVSNLLEGSDTRLVPSEWGGIVSNSIVGAELLSTSQRIDLQHCQNPSQTKLVATPTALQDTSSSDDTNEIDTHDRAKQVPLSNTEDFFCALGLTKEDGKPRPGKSSKLKQCQKFVEIVSGLLPSSTPQDQVDTTSTSESKVSVLDMGCGRGYLTFALHAYLYDTFCGNGEATDVVVRTRGIDVRPKLVEEVSQIAASLGERFSQLEFERGTIDELVAKGPTEGKPEDIQVVIALHACDTATDDALWTGIQQQSDVIVVAPCCHKEIRQQINALMSSPQGKNHGMRDVLRFGVYRERLAETITDSLRALLLEYAGYKVQLFEFIGGEHTAKNVMITAVKKDAKAMNGKTLSDTRGRIDSLVALYGIRSQKLAKWMGFQLDDQPGEIRDRIRPGSMPPPT